MSSIKKNFSYNLVYQILNLVILLVTSPYIARVLGPDKSGIYSYTYSVANFFLLAAMLGVNNYGNRSIALIRDDKEKLSKTFSSIYVLQLLTSAISVTAYVIYLVWIIDANRTVALVQGVYLMSAAFDINWFFFGLEKFKLTVTRNMVIRILSLVGIFVFVKYIGTLAICQKINKVPETDLGRGGTPHQAESGIVHSGTGDQYLQCHGQDHVRNYEYGCTGRLL